MKTPVSHGRSPSTDDNGLDLRDLRVSVVITLRDLPGHRDRRYSYRSASIGAMREARLAGTYAATNVTATTIAATIRSAA